MTLDYRRIGALMPASMQAHVKRELAWAGEEADERQWLGELVALAFVIAVAAGAIAHYRFVSIEFTLLEGLFFFLFVIGLKLILLHNKVEERARKVEEMLPEALHMTASNIKAGMVPIVALRMAARPELGPLKEEIEWVTAKSMGSGSLVDALAKISTRIRSRTLERSMALFASALKSGGSISVLLESMAEEIRGGLEMQERLVAGTRTYVLFILFTVIIAMPALLAVSLQFVDIVNRMELTNASLAQGLGLTVAQPMNYNILFTLSLLTLAVTSIFASALIGVVHRGSKLAGYTYLPITLLGSLIFFFMMRSYVLGIFFPA